MVLRLWLISWTISDDLYSKLSLQSAHLKALEVSEVLASGSVAGMTRIGHAFLFCSRKGLAVACDDGVSSSGSILSLFGWVADIAGCYRLKLEGKN